MNLATKRYAVVASLFALSLITYIDRAAISSAKGAMALELSLSDSAMGMVFSAFALGYAAAQIPAGWFADRFGPRIALALLVAFWSILTSLTGAMNGLVPLLAVRFVFGMSEAGAFPGSARVFYNWLPASERGLANGILFSGALVGGAIAFPFFQWLLQGYGWRHAFYYLGIPGFLWVVCWLICFRDYPREKIIHETTNSGPQLSFGQIFRSRVMALNMYQYFAGNFTFFICLSWFHPYLVTQYCLPEAQAARHAMVPLLFGAAANWLSGLFVDWLYRAGIRAWSRRLPAIIGFALASSGVFAVSLAESPLAAVVAFAVATFGVEMTISPSWAFCLDIGGANSGAVSASMNMVGNFGGFVSANAFPLLQRLAGSSAAYFQFAALLNVLAMLCWFLMRPMQNVSSRPVKPS